MVVVVTYEDRIDALAGVELLARSLHRHSPHLTFYAYSPHSEIAERLSDLPSARWIPTNDLIGHGWNVKPTILMRALEISEQVLWLDSDVIMIRNVELILQRYPTGAIVLGTEHEDPAGICGKIRAEGYDLCQVRKIGMSVNSGAVLIGRQHRELLNEWSLLLSQDSYKAAQQIPISGRPLSLVGDQDALWALLVSKPNLAEEVAFFIPATDMLMQRGARGYSIKDRIEVLKGSRPAFVHMLGRYKPWSFENLPSPVTDFSGYFHLVCFELSPYFEEGRIYAVELSHPLWLKRRSPPAKLLDAIFFGNVALRGFPLALVAWVVSSIGRVIKRA